MKTFWDGSTFYNNNEVIFFDVTVVPFLLCGYKNRPNMTFDDTGAEADQEFDLNPDHSGVLEYKTK